MIPVLDIHVAAFFEYKNYPPELTWRDSRVVIEFPENAETCDLLRLYHLNPMVPVLTYASILGKLRSQIQRLK